MWKVSFLFLLCLVLVIPDSDAMLCKFDTAPLRNTVCTVSMVKLRCLSFTILVLVKVRFSAIHSCSALRDSAPIISALRHLGAGKASAPPPPYSATSPSTIHSSADTALWRSPFSSLGPWVCCPWSQGWGTSSIPRLSLHTQKLGLLHLQKSCLPSLDCLSWRYCTFKAEGILPARRLEPY